MGNPSPAIRRLLRLIPDETKIYLWSDMDYGGFNILSQLRRLVSARVRTVPHGYFHLREIRGSIPPVVTQADFRNLKRLALHPNLRDVRPVIDHLIRRGLKFEQEAIDLSAT